MALNLFVNWVWYLAELMRSSKADTACWFVLGLIDFTTDIYMVIIRTSVWHASGVQHYANSNNLILQFI